MSANDEQDEDDGYYFYQKEQEKKMLAKMHEDEFSRMVNEYGSYISEMYKEELSSVTKQDLFIKLYYLMDQNLVRNFTDDEHWDAFEIAYERG